MIVSSITPSNVENHEKNSQNRQEKSEKKNQIKKNTINLDIPFSNDRLLV